MNEPTRGRTQPLKAILVCPDADLARHFLALARSLPQLTIVGQIESYLPGPELAAHLRHAQPDVLLIEVGSNRQTALECIEYITSVAPSVLIAGINHSNEPDAILQCLRAGVTEFLAFPFTLDDATQAFDRLAKRKAAEMPAEPAGRGHLLAFAPVKGGVGATTIAACVAHRLQRETKGRVLLADFNLANGTAAFILRADAAYSALDAFKHAGRLDDALWNSLVVSTNGFDLLAAPERPEPDGFEPYAVQEVLQYAQSVYDYVVVDLPGILDSMTTLMLPLANAIQLVTSCEMPSMYLMRRTIRLLEETGYSRSQLHILVNRLPRRAELSDADMEKIFQASIHATFRDDAAAVDRALRDGAPVADNSELGKGVGRFVSSLIGRDADAAPKPFGAKALKELFGGI